MFVYRMALFDEIYCITIIFKFNLFLQNSKSIVMRILYPLVCLVLLIGCKTQKPELSILIKEVKDIESINLEEHRNHDVEVYRIKTLQPEEILPPGLDPKTERGATDAVINMSNKGNKLLYMLTIYRNQNGNVKAYKAGIISLHTYENAVYEWINDSTVTFHLSNKFHSHETYTVSGYGGTTALLD